MDNGHYMYFDYFAMVFIASVGVYQIAAIPGRLKGLCFFNSTKLQYAFGIMAILSSFSWFFNSTNRNFQHAVEGGEQLLLFLCAVASSYLATIILAAIIEAKVTDEDGEPSEEEQYERGIETLKTTTLFGGIYSNTRNDEEIEE